MSILDFILERRKHLDTLAEKRTMERKSKGRIRVKSRIGEVLDAGSSTTLFADTAGANPLDFPGYSKKVADLTRRSGLTDAFFCATGTISGHRVICVELVPEFLMGSMGTAVGEAVCLSAEYALEHRLPLIIFSASGGARMQEGMFSLMQMAKTSAAIQRLSHAGCLYISVLTHPTTGGVTASFASLGDIILAEPEALIGFAGPRVIEQTIRATLPEGFQSAEFQQEHGFVDAIVARGELRSVLARLLELHAPVTASITTPVTAPAGAATGVATDTTEKPASKAEDRESSPAVHIASSVIQSTAKNLSVSKETDSSSPAQSNKKDVAVNSKNEESPSVNAPSPAPAAAARKKTPHEHVAIARHPGRPHAHDFIAALFDGFIELRGDRSFADDHALLCGIASFEGTPVTIAAHLKGSDLNENIHCNFGMPHPEGYRKFIRLAKQAEKFGRPLVTFIDTPGAYPGAGAEERGQGEAIARCLFELSGLAVPVIAFVTGEGGSGGALALGLADRVYMYEYAIYSVLSPEGFASILWKDAKRATEASEVMKLTARDLMDFGMIDGIIPEPSEGAQSDPALAIQAVRPVLHAALEELRAQDMETLLANRYAKYRKFK